MQNGAKQIKCNGISPLLQACKNKNNDVIKVLLEYGAPQDPDDNGDTPLHWSCRYNIEAVKLLLNYGAEHKTNNDGETPLFWACENSDLEAIKILLDYGAFNFQTIRV